METAEDSGSSKSWPTRAKVGPSIISSPMETDALGRAESIHLVVVESSSSRRQGSSTLKVAPWAGSSGADHMVWCLQSNAGADNGSRMR